jgi:hypothetical protein
MDRWGENARAGFRVKKTGGEVTAGERPGVYGQFGLAAQGGERKWPPGGKERDREWALPS